MQPDIKRVLENTHPESNYALFSVHEVRALVATVQLLTEDTSEDRAPIIIFGFHPGSPLLPGTGDGSLAYKDYQLTVNGRYVGTFSEVYWQTLMEVLQPLHIPFEMQLHNNLGHGHTSFRSK